MLNKREILKSTLIGIICLSVVITVYIILPSIMDLSNEQTTYHGNPTYACMTPYEISSCINKTNIGSYMFSNNGHAVMDVNFTLKP